MVGNRDQWEPRCVKTPETGHFLLSVAHCCWTRCCEFKSSAMQMISLKILGIGSLKWISLGWNHGVSRDVFLLETRGWCVSFPHRVTWDCSHSLAHSSIFKASNSRLSSCYITSLWPSLLLFFSMFKEPLWLHWVYPDKLGCHNQCSPEKQNP